MRTDIMQLRSVGACGRVSSHTPEYIDEGLVENGAEAVPREVSSFSSSVQRDSSHGNQADKFSSLLISRVSIVTAENVVVHK